MFSRSSRSRVSGFLSGVAVLLSLLCFSSARAQLGSVDSASIAKSMSNLFSGAAEDQMILWFVDDTHGLFSIEIVDGELAVTVNDRPFDVEQVEYDVKTDRLNLTGKIDGVDMQADIFLVWDGLDCNIVLQTAALDGTDGTRYIFAGEFTEEGEWVVMRTEKCRCFGIGNQSRLCSTRNCDDVLSCGSSRSCRWSASKEVGATAQDE